jgi:hypothetical protein
MARQITSPDESPLLRVAADMEEQAARIAEGLPSIRGAEMAEKKTAKTPKTRSAGQIIRRGEKVWLVRMYLGRG